jgi:hypothetical protein
LWEGQKILGAGKIKTANKLKYLVFTLTSNITSVSERKNKWRKKRLVS